MTATDGTRAASIESGDAQTVAQDTHFDARQVLTGNVDDTTVRQAATLRASSTHQAHADGGDRL